MFSPHPIPPHPPHSLTFFRNFCLILCCLNMKYLGIDFFFFFNSNHLVFLRLPGSVVLILHLFGKLLGLYYWYFKYFFRFFLSSSDIPIAYILFLCGCPTVLGHSGGFVFGSSFSLLSSFGSSYWHTFRLADSFLHHVLSVDELIRYITHFSSLPRPICWWACLLIFCWKPDMIYYI